MDIATGIKSLLAQDVCLIPVGEETKAPFISWKGIEERIGEFELFDLMMRYDTNSVAIVLGKVSNGLVCIDIDSKYNHGFDAVILKDIQEMYPDIWEKLRVERTPSGGYHLFYRIKGDDLPKYIQAAMRPATDEELARDPKAKPKCFLEVKCEGGLSQCFPSIGYQLIKGEKIQYISDSEHASLMSLCLTYNQCIKVEQVKLSKQENEFYAESPYDCFDASDEATEILSERGWKEVKKSARYVYYCRPEKSEGVSASFNKSKRLYTIFTSNASIEPKSYSPSNLIAQLDFGGDKKKLYQWLVDKGYGKIKESIEKNIVKRAARHGGELPNNVSEAGKKFYTEEKERFSVKYPYGVFWTINDAGNTVISQKGLDELIIDLGFRVYRDDLYLVDGYLVKNVTDQYMFNAVLKYIGEDEEDVYNAYSKHIDKYGKLTVKRLAENGQLERERLIISTKFESFKFYRNCYISITKDGVEIKDYFDIGDKLIFEKSCIDRDFESLDDREKIQNSPYYQYLALSVGTDTFVREVIGYLTHDYIDDSMNAIIICSEKCEDPRQGGGSGKNLFFNILNHATSVLVLSGRQAELDRNLLQSFKDERVLVISDVSPNFDVSWFKDFSSGAASVKKLYKDVTILERDRMPKPVILTNYSYKMDAGLDRRVIDLEFSDFFSKIRGGVAEHFGMMFPSFKDNGDWNEEDWLAFDNIIVECIQTFLKAGKLIPKPLSDGGWKKQFNQNYKHLYDFISFHIQDWLRIGKVSNDKIKNDYKNFCIENNISKTYSSFYINAALEEYCKYHKIEFDKSNTWATNNNTTRVRGKVFGEKQQNEELPF